MGYQFIIIGSGVAGATIAKNILSNNRSASILMLEAGPEVPMKKRRLWWNYVISGKSPYDFCKDMSFADGENESVGETPWVFKDSRIMTYGGSTVRWGGWCLRLKPEDFELHTRTGKGADWPISYSDLEPFYCHAEEYLSVGGDPSDKYVPRSKPFPLSPFPFTDADGKMIEAFEKLGISFAKMPLTRLPHCMTIGTCNYCPIGARFSASYVLDDLISQEQFPNFTLVKEAVASELLSESKDKIVGVKYFDRNSGKEKVARGDCYIVCGGAYESPKLLLNSKSQYWRDGIGNDNGFVGRFLNAHPFLYVRGTHPKNHLRMQQEIDFPTLMSRHYDTPKEQANGKLFLLKSRSRPRIDLAREMIKGTSRKKIEEISKGDVEMELQGFMEEFSSISNSVGIASGTNRFGLRQTSVKFARSADFEKHANQNLSLMKEVILNMKYDIIKAGVRPQRGEHAASTCRMSEKPENGVVNANLKVHGVRNLYICSNAVFPSLGAVSPTLTLTALSLRLVNHLTN